MAGDQAGWREEGDGAVEDDLGGAFALSFEDCWKWRCCRKFGDVGYVSRSTGWAVDVGCVKVIDELVNAIGLILFRDLFYVLLSIYCRELVS